MKFPVFDLHCDTVLSLLGDNYFAEGALRSNQFHIDLSRASVFPGYAQCFACFTSPSIKLPGRMTIEDVFERQIGVLLREFNANADLIEQVYSPQEILSNYQKGKMSAILTIENPAGFGYDPELLENLYQMGFRMTTLGWNDRNPLTGSHESGGGLTRQGREFVAEAQRVGMLVDVSHISDEGFWDIMEISKAPVLASHSNSRAVYDVTRNLNDDMFKAICACGGVTGINMATILLGDAPNLDTVCDHILHFMELDPSGKHIALGGDLDGLEQFPIGFEGIQSFEALADKLLERGLSESQVFDIYWNNAFGVIQHAVCDHKK